MFFKICVYFEALKTEKKEVGKNEKNFQFQFRKKKISAPKPIPKLDLDFGSLYQNRISVSHYLAKSLLSLYILAFRVSTVVRSSRAFSLHSSSSFFSLSIITCSYLNNGGNLIHTFQSLDLIQIVDGNFFEGLRIGY